MVHLVSGCPDFLVTQGRYFSRAALYEASLKLLHSRGPDSPRHLKDFSEGPVDN